MSTVEVTIDERLWVAQEEVDEDDLKNEYCRSVYEEKTCKRCDYRLDRHSEVCDTCPAFGGHFRLYRKKDGLFGLPLGDRDKIRRVIPHRLSITDNRSKTRMQDPYKCNMKMLYPYQKEAIKGMIKATNGVLKSKPRTGKTVMAVGLIARLGLKTLVLAHQDDLLRQFLTTFRDENFTNIVELEKEIGYELVKICYSPEDFENHDVCLATYQTFLSDKGRQKLQRIKRLFGLLIVDEVHRGAAVGYSRVVAEIAAKHRYGLTATFDRKDTKEFIVNDVIGNVSHDTAIETPIPTVQLIRTNVYTKSPPATWMGLMKWIARHKRRNELIVKYAVKDIRAGHSLVIPVTLTQHADVLTEMINDQVEDSAVAYTGRVSKPDREVMLDQARSGEIKCIVAMRQMLLGVNVPRWDRLYEVMYIANVPAFTQEVNRVTTPMEGKKPAVRFFLDGVPASTGCFRTCYKVLKEFKFTKGSVDIRREIMYGGVKGSRARFENHEPDSEQVFRQF